MFTQQKSIFLKESSSSLFNNLDVLNTSDETGDNSKAFLSVHKDRVNMVYCNSDQSIRTNQVVQDKGGPINKCNVMQAKWCKLSSQDVLVIANHNGILIYDVSGQLLMFWHNSKLGETNDNSVMPFCRGISEVVGKYVCVGCHNGSTLVLLFSKNSFHITETLKGHAQPVSAIDGLEKSAEVDMASVDESGTIYCYKSGPKFQFVSFISGTSDMCTSIKLLKNQLAVCGYLSGHLRIFNTNTSTVLAEIAAHVRAVSGLDYCNTGNENNNLIVSGSEDSFIRVWKVSQTNTIHVTHEWNCCATDSRICGVKFCDGSGKTIAVSAYDSKEILLFSET